MRSKIFSLICILLIVNSAFSVTVKNKSKIKTTKGFNPRWVLASHIYSGHAVKDINNGADNTFLIHKTDYTGVIVNSAGVSVMNIPACDNKIVYKDVNQVWCLTSVGSVFRLVNNAWEYRYAGPYRDIAADQAHDGLLFFCTTHGHYIRYVWSITGSAGSYPGGCLRIKATDYSYQRDGLFIVGVDNKLYSWYLPGERWLNYGGWLTDVAHTSGLQYAAVIGGSHTLYTNDFINGYRGYTGAVKRITFGPDNRLYGVGLDHRIYEFQTQKITYTNKKSPQYRGFTSAGGDPNYFVFSHVNSSGYAWWESNGSHVCENYGGTKYDRHSVITTCKWKVIAVAPDHFCIKNYHTGKFLKLDNGYFRVWDTVCWTPNQWNLYEQ